MNIYQLANFICHFNSHAHVERDVGLECFQNLHFYFNSHAHVERDDFKIRIISATVAISTHTLTWSVTLAASSTISIDINFNSHAHVERDGCARLLQIYQESFQLTRSRGA